MSSLFSQPAPHLPAPFPPRVPQGTVSPTPTTRQTLDTFEQWREEMLVANRTDPRCILLARKVREIDADDTEVHRSGLYRSATLDDHKELELTVTVCYHLHEAVREAIIQGNYEQLVQLKYWLPRQLGEEITEATAEPRTRDVKSIPSKKAQDANGRDYLYELRRPVIYQHYLVGSDKKPPTYEQFDKIADQVQIYLDYAQKIINNITPRQKHRDDVQSICEAFLAPYEEGDYRDVYVFDAEQPRYGVSPVLLKAGRQLIAVIRHAVNNQPLHGRREPLYICSETGWTINPNKRRFQQQEHGKNSNKLMNLVEAAARVACPKDDFLMKWIIVAEPVDLTLVAAAERVISRLGSSYSTCGGTNSELAGLSNMSALQGETPFLIACRIWGAILQKRVEEEKKIVSQQELEVRGVLATCQRVARIRQIEKKVYDQSRDGRDLESRIRAAEKKVGDVAQEWSSVVKKQMEALREDEKLASFARRLERIMQR